MSPRIDPLSSSRLVPRMLRLIGAASDVDRDAASRVRARLGIADLNAPDSSLTSVARDWCGDEPACGRCPMQRTCTTGRSSAPTPAGVPFVDLFCGAGGLSLGLEQAGFVPIFAADRDAAAMATYRHNRPWLPAAQAAVVDVADLLRGGALPRAPLLVGGPPCQGFSGANQQPLIDDPRNELYRAFVAAAEQVQPLVVLMENVPGMIRRKADVERDFGRIGYRVHPLPVDTASYGLPQRRRRLVWLAIRGADGPADRLVEQARLALAPDPAAPQFVLQDAIGDLPELHAKTLKNATWHEDDRSGWTVSAHPGRRTPYLDRLHEGREPGPFLFNHRTKFNNARDIAIYGLLSPGEQSDAASVDHLMPFKSRAGIFKDKFFKLQADRQSKTMTAHMYYDCHMYIHPTQARGLTPRESARLQGFGDDYLFCGYPNEWYRQSGNAVSPLLARRLGGMLQGLLERLQRVAA